MIEESILISTKKVLGIQEGQEAFDVDVIMHINTAFSTLNQLGIGPDPGFMIEGDSETWDEFVTDIRFNMIRTYVFLKVSMLFDPPVLGYLVDAKTNQIQELEWRMSVLRDQAQEEVA